MSNFNFGPTTYYPDADAELPTEAEVLQFANAIREAGGGDLLPGLLPATPGESEACLIAVALNFGCEVAPDSYARFPAEAAARENEFGAGKPWAMRLNDFERDTALKIGEALNLPVSTEGAAIALPRRFSLIAESFDQAQEDYDSIYWADEVEEYPTAESILQVLRCNSPAPWVVDYIDGIDDEAEYTAKEIRNAQCEESDAATFADAEAE